MMSVKKSSESFRNSVITASSGKKYPVYKVCDLVPDYSSHKAMDSGTNHIGNPRSWGKKYQPVRISTANFDPPGSRNLNSTRKTMLLSSRKPIRNIHKLLESPKRNARKRLDNLYDCNKPKEDVNPINVKAQALSAKKLAVKTPLKVVEASDKKPGTKTGELKSKQSCNSRQSRLLPPGTITGSYINKRNSLAPRISIYKPANNRVTLLQTNSQSKRPSDVHEESPQPLEPSDNSFVEGNKLPSSKYTANKSTKVTDGIENDEKEKSAYCCQCSRTRNGSNASEYASTLPNTNIKITVNSKEVDEQDLGESKAVNTLQRPTVIVMQKEIAAESPAQDFNESIKVPVHDGSYSEILSMQPTGKCTEVDESLLFKNIESSCTRLENANELKEVDNASESIFQLMNTHTEMLIARQKHLMEFIVQYEANITSMKLMLQDVNAQLSKQKILESTAKLRGLSSLNNEELSKLALLHIAADGTKQNSDTASTSLDAPENSETSPNENHESGKDEDSLKATKQRKSRKSVNAESRSEEKGNDSAKNVLSDLNKGEEKDTENIENQPPQRRRSARLAQKNADLSIPVVQSTPASERKKVSQAKSKPCTPNMTTPARGAKWGRRSERPLREYMVLKSAIKFLNTPDSRRYQIGSDEKVKVCESTDKTDQVLLTDKLLKELHDLYATP